MKSPSIVGKKEMLEIPEAKNLPNPLPVLSSGVKLKFVPWSLVCTKASLHSVIVANDILFIQMMNCHIHKQNSEKELGCYYVPVIIYVEVKNHVQQRYCVGLNMHSACAWHTFWTGKNNSGFS